METYKDELYHHGIKGMKWGVRRKMTNAVGSRAARSIKDRTERRTIEGRINKHERKAKQGDRNFLYRNTMGDYRRGQAARLKNVKAHRDAKAAYKQNKTSENKAALRDARTKRVVRNTAGHLLAGRGGRGAYHRYRKSGNDKTTAALKTVGKVAATGLALNGAALAGKAIANKYLQSKGYYY